MSVRIVIVGAGFAGLETARRLAGAEAEITLIDRRNYHLFQPLLYQVATAALSPADIAWPIRRLLRDQPNVRVVMGRVTGVDAQDREVVLEDGGRHGYEMLVLATGARHNYFGNDSWAGDAPGLKKIDDATAIRCRLLAAFEEAETCADPGRRAALLSFVVVGGGPTGVEMAGAIAELARCTLRREFRSIDTAETRILLVESGPRVLAAFPEALSERALGALRRLGVEVRLGRPVTGCDAEGIDLGDERIAAANIVWAAGVAASPAGRWLGIPTDRAGRAIVEPDLTAPGHPEIMVLGDTAAVAGPDGRPVPGVAAAAKQMGRHAARQIRRRLAGRPTEPFRYRDPGSLATIGRNAAVARVGAMQLSGMPAWALWAVAHIWFLVSARNRLMVTLQWGWSWASHARPVRLITGEMRPRPADRPLSRAA
jgi:NADH:ubiquinone reductase (H+-translocating)